MAIIEDVLPHPNADKLYVLKINCGEPRQLVAGIKQFYSPEQLKGKHIIIISNLKPAMLRGVESHGMLLAAQDENGTLALLQPDKEIEPGAAVR